MKTCPSCGGIIGQDCFNPEECAWIAQQQTNIHNIKLQRQLKDLEERIEQLEKATWPHIYDTGTRR